MQRIETPDYTYTQCEVSLADWQKMRRIWSLYGEFDRESHFNLACGIYTKNWVSGGTNERRDHARRYPYREALHAEQVALMSARSDVSGGTLYVCRKSGDTGEFRLSKPCFWCMHNIIDADISKVIYTTDYLALVAFKVSTVKIDPINSLDMDYEMIAS